MALAFTGRNKTNGRMFADLVMANHGTLHRVQDAAQDAVFGRRLCDALVVPTPNNIPDHIEWLGLTNLKGNTSHE